MTTLSPKLQRALSRAKVSEGLKHIKGRPTRESQREAMRKRRKMRKRATKREQTIEETILDRSRKRQLEKLRECIWNRASVSFHAGPFVYQGIIISRSTWKKGSPTRFDIRVIGVTRAHRPIRHLSELRKIPVPGEVVSVPWSQIKIYADGPRKDILDVISESRRLLTNVGSAEKYKRWTRQHNRTLAAGIFFRHATHRKGVKHGDFFDKLEVVQRIPFPGDLVSWDERDETFTSLVISGSGRKDEITVLHPLAGSCQVSAYGMHVITSVHAKKSWRGIGSHHRRSS